MTLTKRDLVTRITEETGLIQTQVSDIVQKALDYISESLSKGDKVELRNFGNFEVKLRKVRVGRNLNKTEVATPARAVVKFKAGKEMRAVMAGAVRVKVGADAPSVLFEDYAKKSHDRQTRRVLEHKFACENVLEELRRLWKEISTLDRNTVVGLSILHGMAELVADLRTKPKEMHGFFLKHLTQIKKGKANPLNIENQARLFGLPVCDSLKDAIGIKAYFGRVGTTENNKARVILLNEQDSQIMDDITVPSVWLPKAYRNEGSGVAWVERIYSSGCKGRFEPASSTEEQ